jgi:hypothetical protein
MKLSFYEHKIDSKNKTFILLKTIYIIRILYFLLHTIEFIVLGLIIPVSIAEGSQLETSSMVVLVDISSFGDKIPYKMV